MDKDLVELLARDFTDDEIMCSDVKMLMQRYYPEWTVDDWYELTCEVRRKRHATQHEQLTAERIFEEMPFFAQAAAQAAVRHLLIAADADRLFKLDSVTDSMAEILYKFFFCTPMDVKTAINRQAEFRKPLSYYEEATLHKRLLEFVQTLRTTLWERGEVLRLRDYE